jgi:hypothetical protein
MYITFNIQYIQELVAMVIVTSKHNSVNKIWHFYKSFGLLRYIQPHQPQT